MVPHPVRSSTRRRPEDGASGATGANESTGLVSEVPPDGSIRQPWPPQLVLDHHQKGSVRSKVARDAGKGFGGEGLAVIPPTVLERSRLDGACLLTYAVRRVAGDEVIEQPTTGKERGLVISDPAADGSQVDQPICHGFEMFDAGLNARLRGVHRSRT